ncbi:MAG: YdeI family protein [Mangrovibacterium sp.]
MRQKDRPAAYENEPLTLTPEFEEKFKANAKAWEFFHTLPPFYRKVTVKWVMSAKQEATRIKRLNELITDSEAGRKIKPLSYLHESKIETVLFLTPNTCVARQAFSNKKLIKLLYNAPNIFINFSCVTGLTR